MDANTEMQKSLAMARSCEEFSADVYKNAPGKENGFIFSPFGVHLILSMLAYGADGDTRIEMKKGLRLPEGDSEGLKGLQALLNSLKNISNIKFKLAFKAFLSKTLNLKKEYESIVDRYFDSAYDVVNFEKVKETVETINSWCAKETKNIIKDIVSEADINDGTAMLLLNAIYFKADWKYQFSCYSTRNDSFYIDEKTKISLPMMHQVEKLLHGRLQDVDAMFVELPFKNEDSKMIVIVPNEINGLIHIEENLESFSYERLSKNGIQDRVGIYLPKFKVQSTVDFAPILQKIGMEILLSGNANFSKISDQPIKAVKVIQKASISVDETGAVATSLTVSIMELKSIVHRNPMDIRADRPFMTIIMYKNVPIFYAKFTGECNYETTFD